LLYKANSPFRKLPYKHSFIIIQKDAQTLYLIRTLLGFGTVKQYHDPKSGEPSFRYLVSDFEGVQRLIQIFSGNLVLAATQKRFKL
jgi:hypothetical protein